MPTTNRQPNQTVLPILHCKPCNRIRLPFLPIFRDLLLSGKKTCTTRTKSYGKVGDTFLAFGEIFTLTAVEKIDLLSVATSYHREEGFMSPDTFIAKWKEIHPVAGWIPRQPVFIHFFQKDRSGPDLKDFNLKFLLALDMIDPLLKHTSSGSNRRHPLLRTVLLHAVKEDIQLDGFKKTISKWQHFIKGVSHA